MALHIGDLGGDDNISEAERAINRRAGVLIVELEAIDDPNLFAAWFRGKSSLPDFISVRRCPGRTLVPLLTRCDEVLRLLLIDHKILHSRCWPSRELTL
jgi:hypothetical protein